MANLSEVQTALKQGDKSKATQLLKTILQKNPSADAWVMAARMTSNPETAKLHLQRALAFEPKHVKARDMLRDLGGKPMSASGAITGGLFSGISAELEKFGENKPILRNFSAGQRKTTAITLFVTLTLVMVVMVGTLLSSPTPPPPPSVTPITVFESDTLVSQWNTSGLNINNLVHVGQLPEVLSKEQIDFTLTDENGSHLVNVFLYNSIGDIVQDGNRLTPLTADGKHNIDMLQTAVIIYPTAMSEASITLLESALNPAPAAPV